MTDPRGRTGRTVPVEDVDDIIGLASELEARDAERLSEAQVREVAAELGVAERHVGPAIAELARRRAEAEAARVQRAKTRRAALLAGGAAVALLIIWGLTVNASLGAEVATVAQLRAQIANVEDRQRETRAQWDTQPNSPARSAELSGAQNRVHIERRRHDEAAAAYNGRVAAFPGRLWAALFGHPARVPLSTDTGADAEGDLK
jgi:hypothetical protein